MKFQVVKEKKASGYKWVVQVVYLENGKTKKKNKAVYQINEKRLAEAYRKKLQGEDFINIIDQNITFEKAFNDYFISLEQDTTTNPESSEAQIGYIKNHAQPYINKTYLHEYLYSDFKEKLIPAILSSKWVMHRTKNGQSYKIRSEKTLGRKSVKNVVDEFKKFVQFCKSHNWKIDYSITEHKFSKNFFKDYVEKIAWMPTNKDVLNLIKNETDLKCKAFWKLAAETGMRLNELLGLTYDCVRFEDFKIHVQHSMCSNANEFRPGVVKTLSSNRVIEITDELAELLQLHMKSQIFPKKVKGTYAFGDLKGTTATFTMLFDFTHSRAVKKIKERARKILGIEWKNGISPFRKFSASLFKDHKIFTDKQFKDRYGWSNLKTFGKFYQRDLNANEPKRRAAINNLMKIEG